MEKQLYQEVVDRGYFTASPEATRERWKHTSSVLLIVVLVAGAIGIVTVGATIAFLWFTIAVAAALAFVLRRLSAHLPARTEKGAEAAAKWLAFKRYLGDINKYEKLDESKAIFEKYLAFAIAFDLDEAYVNQFMDVGAPIPRWFGSALGPVAAGELIGAGRGRGYNQWGGPLGGPIGGGWNLGGPGGGRSSGGGGGVNVPGLQGMSDDAAKGVQGASGGFLDMLNKAAQALGSSGGNSSRGSWGGGGGHGGGFSGGGSHGGGGGGGGRGFH